jgi:flagellar biogenesis protein FliO
VAWLEFGRKTWAATAGRLLSRWEAVRPARRLRLCETVALGEKRFVAVVQFERSRFLIGGAPNSVVLLTTLKEDAKAPFTKALAMAEQKQA